MVKKLALVSFCVLSLAASASAQDAKAVIASAKKALGDPAWWVRFRAGEALAMLGDKGVAGLRGAVGADQDVVRRAASLALAEHGLMEAAP